jgi:uncharacterized protein YkwD
MRAFALFWQQVFPAAVLAVMLTLLFCPHITQAQNRSSFFVAPSGDPNRPSAAQHSPQSSPQRAAASTTGKTSSDAPSGPEKILFDQLNESRVLTGLSPLRWDANLAAAARKHCALLVQHDALSHQFPGEEGLQQRLNDAGVEFSAAAENVAMAPTADEIHYEWMHSPPHRANILDPKLTVVGIATMQGNKGVYAVQDFVLAVEKMNLGEQEEKIRTLIGAAGLHTADNPERTQWSDARKTCQMAHDYAGKPAFVARFDTSDLNKLPPELQKSLTSGKYHVAAVGACSAPNDAAGFTNFRFAVLLY